jgi:hypothetical protein
MAAIPPAKFPLVVSSAKLRKRRIARRQAFEQASSESCSKNGYLTQAEARTGLAKVLELNKYESSRKPIRVYPCDTCELWHLTSKRNRGRTPPWDLDPNWVRPAKPGG